MKRLCLAMLTGLMMQVPTWPCGLYDPPRHNRSPNGRYDLVTGNGGIRFFRGTRQLWTQASEWGDSAVVSDAGDLIVCRRFEQSVLYDSRGQQIAQIENNPPEFELDPPRACWTRHGFHYLESSQGDIFLADQNRWRKMSNVASLPGEISRHRQASVSDRAIEKFLEEEDWRIIPPNFRNLNPAQIQRLKQNLRAGRGRAALVLGLARCEQARPELLQASFTPDSEPAELAQKAVCLLDGPAAAQELVPALKGWTSPYLMRLYEQVPCPDAVPLLLGHLTQAHDCSSHAALVAQTRVDLGYRLADWQAWLANNDKNRLDQFQEPSAPLWKAQQEAPDLAGALLKQPRLIGRFDLDWGRREQICLKGDRLIRREGRAKPRCLEWSLTDGRPQLTIPPAVPDESEFRWNTTHQLLYFRTEHSRGVWRGQQQVFLEDWGRPGPPTVQGQRPFWLSPDLYAPHFGPDDSYVCGGLGGKERRQSLVDGTFQEVKSHGLTSPDGRCWLGPNMLMDLKLGLIYRPTMNLQVPCFSPDSRLLAAAVDGDIALFDATNLRPLRRFRSPYENVEQIALDQTHRRLALVGDTSVSVYDLNPQAPDLTGDSRLVAECWSGYRLSGGGARMLTEAEYWQRRRRLAELPACEPIPYLPIVAGLLATGLLGMAYAVNRTTARSGAPGPGTRSQELDAPPTAARPCAMTS